MKKTLDIDAELLAKAKEATGASADTDVVRLGLEALVRTAAYQQARLLLGTESYSPDVPRRREKPASSRKKRAA